MPNTSKRNGSPDLILEKEMVPWLAEMGLKLQRQDQPGLLGYPYRVVWMAQQPRMALALQP